MTLKYREWFAFRCSHHLYITIHTITQLTLEPEEPYRVFQCKGKRKGKRGFVL